MPHKALTLSRKVDECKPLAGGVRRPGHGGGGAAAQGQGEAVQVEPMKLMLKPPGTKRLKLKYYKLLSILLHFCFQINLRRYSKGGHGGHNGIRNIIDEVTGGDKTFPRLKVARCKMKPVESRVESAWFQRLKLKCDEVLNFAICCCGDTWRWASGGRRRTCRCTTTC